MPKSSLSKARASRQQIMDAAAKCIALKGYDGTTMRDIASTAKFLPGSIYYHFSSKDDLLLALNEEATSQISDRVLSSIDGITDPWVRIERACCAYLQCLSKDNYYALVALTEFPRRRSTELEEKLKPLFKQKQDKLTKHERNLYIFLEVKRQLADNRELFEAI